MAKLLKIAAMSLATMVLAGTLLPAGKAASARSAGETESNRTAVAKGLQAWADGTGSPYDLLAENVHWTITGNSRAAKTYPSKEAFMSEVIRPFNARMGERLIPSAHRLYAEDDTVIAHFDASGVARDGKPYVNSYAWILRMQGGKIVEAHAFFDAIAFDDLWTRVTPASRP
jgi:ketosteroid isomerase-like protein